MATRPTGLALGDGPDGWLFPDGRSQPARPRHACGHPPPDRSERSILRANGKPVEPWLSKARANLPTRPLPVSQWRGVILPEASVRMLTADILNA